MSRPDPGPYVFLAGGLYLLVFVTLLLGWLDHRGGERFAWNVLYAAGGCALLGALAYGVAVACDLHLGSRPAEQAEDYDDGQGRE